MLEYLSRLGKRHNEKIWQQGCQNVLFQMTDCTTTFETYNYLFSALLYTTFLSYMYCFFIDLTLREHMCVQLSICRRASDL